MLGKLLNLGKDPKDVYEKTKEIGNFTVKVHDFYGNKDQVDKYFDEYQAEYKQFFDTIDVLVESGVTYTFHASYDDLTSFDSESPTANGYFTAYEPGNLDPYEYAPLSYWRAGVHIDIDSVSSLAHETGHAIDYKGYIENGDYLREANGQVKLKSHFKEFNLIQESFEKHFQDLRWEYLSEGKDLSDEYIDYATKREEVFAVGFDLWYNANFGSTKLVGIENYGIREDAMFRVINELGDQYYNYYNHACPEILDKSREYFQKDNTDDIIFYGYQTKRGQYQYHDAREDIDYFFDDLSQKEDVKNEILMNRQHLTREDVESIIDNMLSM